MSAVTGLVIACLAFSAYGSPSVQIVGGGDAVYPHPYQAALFVRSGSNTYFACGGAIITKRYVITAAYCIPPWSERYLDFYVGVGSALLNETIRYRVDAFIPHANYNPEARQSGINNIGLVRVTTDIAFNENVQPIKLPDNDRNYDDYPFIVTGWGKTEGEWSSARSNTLQELVVKGVPCWNKPYILCIYSQLGEGLCTLDHGNPVVADGVLVAIATPRFIECGTSEHFVDPCTKVFYYKTWIEYHVGGLNTTL